MARRLRRVAVPLGALVAAVTLSACFPINPGGPNRPVGCYRGLCGVPTGVSRK